MCVYLPQQLLNSWTQCRCRFHNFSVYYCTPNKHLSQYARHAGHFQVFLYHRCLMLNIGFNFFQLKFKTCFQLRMECIEYIDNFAIPSCCFVSLSCITGICFPMHSHLIWYLDIPLISFQIFSLYSMSFCPLYILLIFAGLIISSVCFQLYQQVILFQ